MSESVQFGFSTYSLAALAVGGLAINRNLKRTLWIGAPVAFVVALVAYLMTRPKPLEWHVERVVECTFDADAGCLWKYVRQSERDAYGIDRQSFGRLLRDYVRPALGEPRGESIATVGNASFGAMIGTIETVLKDGSSRQFMIEVAETDNGVVAPKLVTALVFERSLTDYYQTSADPSATGKLRAYLEWATTDGPMLEENYGLRGIIQSERTGFITWQEYRDKLVEQIAELEAEQAAS